MRYGNQRPTFEVVGAYHHSLGPKLIELFKKSGTVFYPCQEYELTLFAARNEDNRFAARTISISKPRQNGKSFSARKYALAMGMLGYKVLYSAHNGITTRKMFHEIDKEIDYVKSFAQKLKKRVSGKGSEGFYFESGGFIEFQTRTTSGARGGTYDIIIIDEAQELIYEELDAIKPTTIASESGDPQTIFIGTPPGPKCRGEVFSDQHKAAHAWQLMSSWWLEWAAAKVPQMDDREAVLELAYQTNPALGYRIREDVMIDAIDSYVNRPDSYAREYLGWWASVERVNIAINAWEWERCATETPPKDGKIAYGIKYTQDGLYAAIGVAMWDKDGAPHVELVRYLNMAEVGATYLTDFIDARKNKAAVFTIDGKAGADDLAARLVAAGIHKQVFTICSPREYTAAASMFLNAVRECGLTHIDQKEVKEALATVTKRPVGTNGAYGFGGDNAEIVDCLALALYGVRTSKRDPTRRAVVW